MTSCRKAMILAAGLGTRLRPLTEHIPKPLVPVLGRPLLENVIVNLRACGVSGIAINTHHLPEKIEEFVAGLADPEGIVLFHEPRILGTGGALVNARPFLSDGPFLLHNGDVLTDLDLPGLLAAHREDSVATLALVDFAPENKVLLAPDGRVVDIVGKLGASSPEGGRLLTYACVAVLSPAIFDYLPPQGPSSLIEALLRAIAEKPGSVRAVPPGKFYWNDLGTLRRYRHVHEDILARRATALPGIRQPEGKVYAAPGAHVSRKAKLSGWVCVGAGARVESEAELSDAIVFPGAVARRGKKYLEAVVGKDFCISHESTAARECRIVAGRGYGPGLQISPLVEQGSDRQFFRLCDGARCEVLMLTPRHDPDFLRYLEIGRFLHQRDLGGPEILAADEEQHAVLLEDLGDGILYLSARHEKDPAMLEGLYSKVVDYLAGLQARATRDIKDCPAVDGRAMDYDHLRWETNYFRDNFLRRLLAYEESHVASLDAEFHALALTASHQPQVFMHRDFQSQNILMKGGRVRIVDFQGARRGPVAYDLASLLKDPYVMLDTRVQDRLAERYRLALAEAGGLKMEARELSERLLIAGLQRNMQALGAYSFLWLVKGKAQFRKFIQPGLSQVEHGLARLAEESPSPGPLVGLSRLLVEAGQKLPAAFARVEQELSSMEEGEVSLKKMV